MSDTPKTAAEWLALGDELPRKLAEVLTPGPWKHDVKAITAQHVKCNKCRKTVCVKGQKWDFPNSQPCPVPDPIVIDWNTAKYWQGKIDLTLEPFLEMYEVVFDRERASVNIKELMGWMIALFEPEDAKYVLIAAALAEGAKE